MSTQPGNPHFRILPSILSADFGKLVEEARQVDLTEIEFLHVDVMDGHFVPNLTFGPRIVQSLRQHTRFKLDVHLMIENVERQLPWFIEAEPDILTVHVEAAPHLHRILTRIKDSGIKAGVALNPATPLETVRWVLDVADLVLVMSVNPGFGGQRFIPFTLEKIKELNRWKSERNGSFIIEVDGGVGADNIGAIYLAGAEFLVAGNAIFGKPNRQRAIRDLIRAVEEADRKTGLMEI